jgi:hypothetical protein
MFRKYLELLFIKIAIMILKGRNVERAMIISRRDNNDMWAMSERLEIIMGNIKSGYKNIR